MTSAVTAATTRARDDLRRAAAEQRGRTWPWEQPADAGVVLSNLSSAVVAMNHLLGDLQRRLARRDVVDNLEAVDGLFEGDPLDAVRTATLWLTSATATCARLQHCLDNANIALAGIAETT